MSRSVGSIRLYRAFVVLAIAAGTGSLFGMNGQACNPDMGTPNGNPNDTPTPTPAGSQTPPGGVVNNAPTVKFKSPLSNMSIQDGTPVQIMLQVIDPEDSTRVSLFADYDDTSVSPSIPRTVVIVQGKVVPSGTSDQPITWNTANVQAATYTLRVLVTDQINSTVSVTAPGRVTILPRPGDTGANGTPPPAPNNATKLAIVQPQGGPRIETGTQLRIIWQTTDFEDPVRVNVTARLNRQPDPITIPLVVNKLEQPGVIRDEVTWDTTGQPVGTWQVTITARETPVDPNQVPNPDPSPIVINVDLLDPGTGGGVNGAPELQIVFPTSSAGLTDGDELDLLFFLRDPNSDVDSITLDYFLDTDQSSENDNTQPPIMVGGISVPAGFAPPNQFVLVGLGPTPAITIDVTRMPVREETDEAGRPLPYYVRVRASDGKGGITNQYAPGAIYIVRPPADLVDMLEVGGSVSGATFQGFNGEPFSEARGSRAGSAVTGMGDVDGDGIGDFAIAAQTATPFNRTNAGMVYLIYGRNRQLDPAFGFVQGRYSGVIDLNQVGLFSNGVADVFNIRGTQLYGSRFVGNTNGISDIATWPDVTGDGLPELLIGQSMIDSALDEEDNDPCDTCELPKNVFGSFICLTNPELRPGPTNNQPIMGTLDQVMGTVPANSWAPSNPMFPPFNPNCELDTADDEHIVGISRVVVLVSGEVHGQPGQASLKFTVQLDVTANRGDGRIVRGVQASSLPVNVTLDPDGNFTFNNIPVIFDNLPYFPAPLQPPPPAPFNDDTVVDLTNPAQDAFVAVPPSVYDGLFNVFIKSTVPTEYDTVEVQVSGLVAGEQESNYAYEYFDSSPDHISTSNCDTPRMDILGAGELIPACPPNNDDAISRIDESGFFCTPLEAAGLLFADPTGFDDDDIFTPRDPRATYRSGNVVVAASDDMALFNLFDGVWSGLGLRTAEIDQFGQSAGPRGARIRGAWYQGELNPFTNGFASAGIEYDQNNRFGTTVNTMPDIDATTGRNDLIISSPGSGLPAIGTYDLNSMAPNGLLGTYKQGQSRAVKLNYLDATRGSLRSLTDGRPWSFSTFSSVAGATLRLTVTGNREARIQIQLVTPGGPIQGTAGGTLLWRGDANLNLDYELPEYINAPAGGTVNISLPRSAGNSLLATNFNNTNISLELRVLPDCAVTNQDVSDTDQTSVTVSAASWTIVGLAPDVGQVTIIDGRDLTLETAAAGFPQDGVASWPALRCNAANRTRELVYPRIVTTLLGENPLDQFGWGDYGGDLDGDHNPDVTCGAPGNDNDPNNSGGLPLVDNGKAFCIFGTTSIGSGVAGPPFERLEVRGTHDGDGFGRVQGNAGDFAQTVVDLDDTFFAAGGYDAIDGLDGVPIVGADAGFVGVLFGGSINTGEVTLRCEKIGTGNFKGIKYIGGSPGARLGDAVAGAGDFNRDGFDDLIITAPGQKWPGSKLKFRGPVADGDKVFVNNTIFEFDTNNAVSPGARRIDVSASTDAEPALQALLANMKLVGTETLGATTLVKRTKFATGVIGSPTLSMLSRTRAWTGVATTSANIEAEEITRQGVTYIVYGDTRAKLENKVRVLPDDMNRRDNSGNRVVKGVILVSGYEKDSPGVPIIVNFESGGTEVTSPEVVSLASFSGGVQGNPGAPTLQLTSSGTQGYVVTAPGVATVTFDPDKPPCEITTSFLYQNGVGVTAPLIRAFDVAGNPISGLQSIAGKVAPMAGLPVPTPVLIRSSGAQIGRIELRFNPGTPAGTLAVLDDFVLSDGTPDEAAVTVVEGIGDVDGDGFLDVMLGAPTADFVNDLSPCNRRRSAGDVYLLYGNDFGLNKGTQP